MKKLTGLAALAVVVWSVPVFACDKDKHAAEAKHAGCQGKEAQTVAAKEGCHGKAGSLASKVMDKLPTMTYRVGDFNTPCPQTAAEKAGTEGKVQYVVDGKAYDCKGEATTTLAALIEKEAAEMMTVHYAVGEETYGCPMAAKDAAAQKQGKITYRLAGVNYASQAEADKVAKLVSEAVAKLATPEDSAVPADAAAKSGCSKAKAETASATGGCSKAKAETASATGGCSKAKAETASAAGGCAKTKAATAAGKAGCCSKDKAATASASKCCQAKDGSLTGDCCETAEKRLASAKAKLQVIIETVLASSNS